MSEQQYTSVVQNMRLPVSINTYVACMPALASAASSALQRMHVQQTGGVCVAGVQMPVAAAQNDVLFGLPVVLDTDSKEVGPGDRVLLKYQGQALAVFTCDSKWAPNKPLEAKHCYGTTSIEHPAVQMICMERGKYYLGARCGYARSSHPRHPWHAAALEDCCVHIPEEELQPGQ